MDCLLQGYAARRDIYIAALCFSLLPLPVRLRHRSRRLGFVTHVHNNTTWPDRAACLLEQGRVGSVAYSSGDFMPVNGSIWCKWTMDVLLLLALSSEAGQAPQAPGHVSGGFSRRPQPSLRAQLRKKYLLDLKPPILPLQSRTTRTDVLRAVAPFPNPPTSKTALQPLPDCAKYCRLLQHTLFSAPPPSPVGTSSNDQLLNLSPPPTHPQEPHTPQLPHRTLFGLLLLFGEESRRPRPPLSHAYEPFRPP
jgi:hypothetical protein